MDSDRNLLFGVLALQADLIDTVQFVEVCSLWATRKNVPLADLLVGRGWIEPADKSHVDYLVERKLQKHGGDAKASLAGVADDVKRSLAAVDDPEIQGSLAGLPRTNGPALEATVDLAAVPRSRYSLTRLHATGGIGRIWLAHDADLGRDVALKELRPERADDTSLWSRFLKEAKITGQLEHPGVVPVYELARRPENQQPFYTMQFVKGRTLTEVARGYHRKRAAGQADSIEFLTLLNAFVTVCNTVAYAHARGVIHRDLKGQNVILGDFGEVVVLDWGLAKLVDQPESDAASPPPVLATDGMSAPDLTAHGQTIGTPAYMAPEQAAGRPDLIDSRTDVHGLGAMLYEILTGEPPFTGADTLEVLRKVREEEAPRPRALWPDVPSALEAVCLKALAKRPTERHASATELGQDVQHWQEMQRRKAEDALRASEALYHSLVETIPLYVWRKDAESRFTFANRGFCDATRLDQTEILGKTDFDLYPAELAAKYQEDDAKVMATGKILRVAEEHVTAEGRRLYVEVIKIPIHDLQGTIIGTQGVFWDLTEWKRIEEELRQSRERFELAVSASQDGLLDWDVKSGRVYCSPRLNAMLGHEERETWSTVDVLLFQRVHPKDRECVKAALQAFLDSRKATLEIEYRVLHKDGSYRWILDRAAVLRDADGKPYRMAGSQEDITARKLAEEALRESEERYGAIVAAMQDGIILLDTDGRISAINASAERILGLSADQLVGRASLDPGWRFIHEDGSSFPGETHPAIETLRSGQPCRDIVMGVHKPDGSVTWISVNSQPLFRADGMTLCGVVSSAEDITDRRKTEEELRRTLAELESIRTSGKHPTP